MTLLSGKSFCRVVCDRETRIEVITLEKLALLIGKVKVDSCRRCEDSRSSSGDFVLDMPLTRIWLRDRPMKSNELAVGGVTNAGKRFGLLAYSYIISVSLLSTYTDKLT